VFATFMAPFYVFENIASMPDREKSVFQDFNGFLMSGA
jgi:hypothetical protein